MRVLRVRIVEKRWNGERSIARYRCSIIVNLTFPTTRPVFPRISSRPSAFFFCGIKLLPVLLVKKRKSVSIKSSACQGCADDSVFGWKLWYGWKWLQCMQHTLQMLWCHMRKAFAYYAIFFQTFIHSYAQNEICSMLIATITLFHTLTQNSPKCYLSIREWVRNVATLRSDKNNTCIGRTSIQTKILCYCKWSSPRRVCSNAQRARTTKIGILLQSLDRQLFA